MLNIKCAVSGISGWNTIFELENGLFAMCNVSTKEPVQFSMNPTTFLRHGYFESPQRLNSETITQACATLQYYLSDVHLLDKCIILGDRKTIRKLLGLCEEENT